MSKNMSNIAFSLVYYVLNLFVNFFIASLAIKCLGSELYSFYPLANNICGWMVIISSALNSMLARNVSVARATGKEDIANKYYSTAISANIIIAIFLSTIIFAVVAFANKIFNVPQDSLNEIRILLFSVLLTVPIDMMMTPLSISWTVKDKLLYQYILRIIQCVVKVSIIIAFSCNLRMKISHVGYAVLISDVVYSFFTWLTKKHIMPDIVFDIRNFEVTLLKNTIIAGVWNSLMQLGNSLLFQFDLLICNILIGVNEAGSISIVTTIPNAITSVVTLLCSVFLPKLYMNISEKNKKTNTIEDVRQAQTITGLIIGVGIVFFLNTSMVFFDLWVPGNNSELLSRLSVFYLIPLVFSAIFRPVNNLIIAMNKLRTMALIMVFSGAINFISMFILVQHSNMGVYSVVFTTFVLINIIYCFIVPIYVSQCVHERPCTFYKPLFIVVPFLAFAHLIDRIVISGFEIKGWLEYIFCALICMIIEFGVIYILLYTLKAFSNRVKGKIG